MVTTMYSNLNNSYTSMKAGYCWSLIELTVISTKLELKICLLRNESHKDKS